MIRVFFLDDEAIARINLRYLINWEKEGFTICGESDNGLDALKKVKELKPDIIFSDMNMTDMNGIEFIKRVREIYPSIRIIAFSAFDDFEYVRQSLMEGALDYLVKHKLDAQSLLAILNTIKEKMEEETIEKQKTNRIMAMASSGKVFIQKNVLMNLLNGYIQEDFKAIMREYDIDLDEKNLVVAIARVNNFYHMEEDFTPQEFSVFMQTIEAVLSNLCSEIGKTVYVYMEEGKFAFIMSFAEIIGEARINSNLISNICNIQSTVKRFVNITMSFGVSSICPSFARLKDYYNEACLLLESGYYRGSNYIMQKDELVNCDVSHSLAGLSVSQEKDIISCVRGLKRDCVLKTLEKIFEELKEKRASFDSVKIVSIDLINLIKRMAKEFDININRIYPDSISMYEEIKKFSTLDELLAWFIELYNSLMDVYEVNNISGSYSPVVKEAIKYILNNFDRDISLSNVSEQVNVSPQYLSKLFKEECGIGFVNYLNNVRIEQAKRMINEGEEIKHLAQKSGFNNYTYFFTVFKEITGMTPQQYDKVIAKRRNNIVEL